MANTARHDRAALARLQGARLAALVARVLPENRFYAERFAAAGVAPDALRHPDDLARLPFTTKDEIVADQDAAPPGGRRLTWPGDCYTRLHQTSGTSTGRPLRCYDTAVTWEAMLDSWAMMFDLIGLTSADRLFFPFSFGPFLGFWTAFEAGCRAGCLCLPGGGLSSGARLRFLLDQQATVVFATPTYALRLAEVAAADGIDLAGASVRLLVVAGEPGGNIASTRAKLAEAWGAHVVDHYGLTEVGPVAVECPSAPDSLTVIEQDYVAEVIDPATGAPCAAEAVGELVLTPLHRAGHPLFRYRTGDLVRAGIGLEGRLSLAGGILGRADEMIQVRGNNLYPAAIEAVLRRFPELAEFRVEVRHRGPLAEVTIAVEPTPGADGPALARAAGQALRDELLFRVDVSAVAAGTLPRFEMKAQRFVKL